MNYSSNQKSDNLKHYVESEIRPLYSNKSYALSDSYDIKFKEEIKNEPIFITLTDEPSSHSSEHIVFYGIMKTSTFLKNIIMKFKINYTDDGFLRIVKFTKNHGEQIITNYNLLKNYLNEFKNEDIILNDVYILKNDIVGHIWIENRIEKWEKFWNKEYPIENKLFRISTTTEKILKELQIFIYKKSKNFHTIVDLQGGRLKINDVEKIILTDIEYTNTMDKLHWNADDMLRAIRKIYDLSNNYISIEEKKNFITIDNFKMVIVKLDEVANQISILANKELNEEKRKSIEDDNVRGKKKIKK